MPDIYSMPPYPLEQVLDVKKRRVEDAEKTLKEKIRAKEAEEEKLKQREGERDKAKNHYQDKLAKLRHELDEGTTSTKIDRSRVYLKVVQERLKTEEKKVSDQKQQVTAAEKNVEIAKDHLKAKQKEQDKIETHKKEWVKETKVELNLLQTREEDEIGSTMFLSKFSQKREQKG
jgi:flagellar biosynthesis chaperone FliJ